MSTVFFTVLDHIITAGIEAVAMILGRQAGSEKQRAASRE